MLSVRFDPLFTRFAGALPVPFLRALSKRESNLNPNEQEMPAFGLMQVVPVVRDSFNRRFGTSYSHPDLLEPTINVRMATELLNQIVTQYEKHPAKNMKPDWTNPEFVKLVVAGWNSGYSEAGGVGKVARYLERHGLPVTHDNVFDYAGRAGATKHLQNSTKYRWQRSVADLFFQQPDAPNPHSDKGLLLKSVAAVVVGLLAAKYVFK